MEKTLVKDSAPRIIETISYKTDFRDSVWKLLEQEVGDILSEEMKRAAQELLDEQKKMIRQLVEENKTIIRQIIAEEKQAAWSKLGELKRQILTIAP
jgi:hypothetical protein